MTDETRLNDGADLEIATAEDFGIARDENGDLKPVTQRIPGTEKAVLVRPVVDVEPVADVLEGQNPDDDRVDAVAEQHVVEGLGADGDLSSMPDYIINGVLQAIRDSSGHQVFRATQERQVQETTQMLQGLETEQMEALMEMGEATSNGPQP